MQYELIPNSSVGVITDTSPVFRDIKDTFAVSFILPEPGAYIALLRDESGTEYRASIKDGAAKVPKQLLTKEQRIGLTVCKITNEAIEQTWECPTLKVGTFLSLRQTQWHITVGTDDKELYVRLASIEREHAKRGVEYAALLDAFDALQAEFSRHKASAEQAAQEYAERQNELTKALASVKSANETLAAEYNKAIGVINDLSERVTALEKHYDPTLIK